jgi:hypothetical protein
MQRLRVREVSEREKAQMKTRTPCPRCNEKEIDARKHPPRCKYCGLVRPMKTVTTIQQTLFSGPVEKKNQSSSLAKGLQ